MLIKITHPIIYQDRVLLPGETINVPTRVARDWLEQQWAARTAAEVKATDDNRKNS